MLTIWFKMWLAAYLIISQTKTTIFHHGQTRAMDFSRLTSEMGLHAFHNRFNALLGRSLNTVSARNRARQLAIKETPEGEAAQYTEAQKEDARIKRNARNHARSCFPSGELQRERPLI